MSEVTKKEQPTQEVNLRVGVARMTLEIPRSEEMEQSLRRGAEMVNKFIERYRTVFPNVSQVELISYVALDLASRLQKQELEAVELDLEKRLRKLNSDLEQVF
ncbi:MAG: cell division protein ZapA [Bacteroidales bacterium]|uniref:cell division protein ZapA n=1 Tax=Porphyromonas sp. TaxID=1924944 RepID=UPI002974E91E|nr:cell division protein ZapA [Porphyromonas sp.]MDD7438691.1 cell division protein ZapA [Bacteroidales bacterium]MDY3066949.1 cell division protein ZapA [Porphyromonas sp.]